MALLDVLLLAPLTALAVMQDGGSDWPAYRADPGRSAAALDARRLVPEWTFGAQAPRPAWPGPARWDAFAKLEGLGSMREYDPVFHPIAVGDAVYFGSSADDSVVRVDAATGQLVWRFFTEGPVRVAPSFADGRLYFGSDDGRAYCVDAARGEELWRFAAVPDAERFINDGRVISTHPVRTGVLVSDGVAYFGASMFPWEPSYVCALDARTGTLEGDSVLLWRAAVEGRAKGLAAARGRLFVATDEGRLHAFMQGELTAALPDDPLATTVVAPRAPPRTAQRERARAATARALVHEPELVLADEPTGNLDEDSARLVLERLAAFQRAGGAVALVTHSRALPIHPTRTLELLEGRLRTA